MHTKHRTVHMRFEGMLGSTGAGGEKTVASLVKLFENFFGNFRRQRIVTVLYYNLLTLLGKDKLRALLTTMLRKRDRGYLPLKQFS